VQVTLSHRIALDPTVKQEQVLRQAVGVARFAYNWALAEWKRQYEAGEKPNECKLRRQLNAIKGEKFPWMLDVPKSVPQQAIKNLGQACKGFFQGLADYPSSRRSFSTTQPGWTTVRGPSVSPESVSMFPASASCDCENLCALLEKPFQPRLAARPTAGSFPFLSRSKCPNRNAKTKRR